MPKIKTKRAGAKRFKQIGSGRFKRRQSFKRHILTKKSAKRKRQLRGNLLVADADTNAVRRMLNV